MFEEIDLQIADKSDPHFVYGPTVKCTAPTACNTMNNCTDPCGWTFLGC